MAANSSKGNCYLCGRLIAKSSFKRHALTAHPYEGTDAQDCVVLKIENAGSKMYWLYLDISASSTLKTLDTFLRKIWLECCGHLSAFFDPHCGEIGMEQKISGFPAGSSLLYKYDFGDTTQLRITVVGNSRRPKQRSAIRLLGRNEAYRFACGKCGQDADWVCCECMWEDVNPFLCEECSKEHEQDFLLPVVNSPRMGVCGYCGEQDIYEFDPAQFAK